MNFPFIPFIKRTQDAHYSAPSRDAPMGRCPCNWPFLGLCHWVLSQILDWDMNNKISHQRDFLEGPLVGQRSVVRFVNGHCSGSVLGCFGSFFWEVLCGPLELEPGISNVISNINMWLTFHINFIQNKHLQDVQTALDQTWHTMNVLGAIFRTPWTFLAVWPPNVTKIYIKTLNIILKYFKTYYTNFLKI